MTDKPDLTPIEQGKPNPLFTAKPETIEQCQASIELWEDIQAGHKSSRLIASAKARADHYRLQLSSMIIHNQVMERNNAA